MPGFSSICSLFVSLSVNNSCSCFSELNLIFLVLPLTIQCYFYPSSSPVLFCKKSRGTKRPWYWLFKKDTPVPRRFPFNKNFGLKFRKFQRFIPVSQIRSKPPRVCLLFLLQAGYKRAVLGTKILPNGRDFSVGPIQMSGLVKVSHLQRWSQIFRSDRTEMVR